MTPFVDTSGLIAVLNVRDVQHAQARGIWQKLLDSEPVLVTTNYVVVEAISLAQKRLGLDPVRTLNEDFVPLLTVEWVTPDDHRAAVSALLAAGRRQLSLVDCVSFVVMRRLGLRRAFAFDPHFEEQGFEVIPAAL